MEVTVSLLSGRELVFQKASELPLCELRRRLAQRLQRPSFALRLLQDSETLPLEKTWEELGKPCITALQTPWSCVDTLERNLLEAVRSTRAKAVEAVLAAGQRPDCDGPRGDTPLSIAARRGMLDVVDLLLEAGADVNRDRSRGSPLMEAAGEGHLEVVQKLLEVRASVNYGAMRSTVAMTEDVLNFWQCETALHRAARSGHQAVLQLLVESRGDPTLENRCGETPLLLFLNARAGQLRVEPLQLVQTLVDASAEVNYVGPNCRTALLLAAKMGFVEVAQYLVEKRADVQHQDADGCTALMRAAAANHTKLLQLLLDCEAEVNTMSDEGTALTRAAGGALEAAELLLAHRAEVDAKGVDTDTALTLAVRSGLLPVARLLLQHGARVNKKGSRATTALIEAAKKGLLPMTQLLVEAEAELFHKDWFFATALLWAVEGCHVDVARFLLASRADVRQRDANERDALHRVWCTKDPEMIELFQAETNSEPEP
ncbi:unnamed protein product [Effrenium voratum]|uniref:Uncharacterized protein n=1 Tax=Effrenium voratum TaxID=2562239 RepID=A0AA36HUK2_9DINO|nr:unnamed protein product [Effrenium voratum]CAJ1437385.1 unnamed protein product [Effrenium voratum]